MIFDRWFTSWLKVDCTIALLLDNGNSLRNAEVSTSPSLEEQLLMSNTCWAEKLANLRAF